MRSEVCLTPVLIPGTLYSGSVRLWASQVPSLNLSVLFCKMDFIVLPVAQV